MTQRNGEHASGAKSGQVPGTPSQTAAGGYKVAIRRISQSVEITLTSGSEYDSIEMYDRLIQSVKTGSLRIEVKLAR